MGSLSAVTTTIQPMEIYRLNTVPVKTQQDSELIMVVINHKIKSRLHFSLLGNAFENYSCFHQGKDRSFMSINKHSISSCNKTMYFPMY